MRLDWSHDAETGTIVNQENSQSAAQCDSVIATRLGQGAHNLELEDAKAAIEKDRAAAEKKRAEEASQTSKRRQQQQQQEQQERLSSIFGTGPYKGRSRG